MEKYTFYVNSLHDIMQLNIHDFVNNLKTSNLILVVDYAMKEIGKVTELTGKEKHAVVITTIKLFLTENIQKINELEEDANIITFKIQEELKLVSKQIDQSLDTMINQLYQLSPISYGKTKTKFLSYFSFCKC